MHLRVFYLLARRLTWLDRDMLFTRCGSCFFLHGCRYYFYIGVDHVFYMGIDHHSVSNGRVSTNHGPDLCQVGTDTIWAASFYTAWIMICTLVKIMLFTWCRSCFYMGLWVMIVTCAYIAIVTWAQIMDFSPTICMSGTIASAGTDKRPRQKVQAKEVSWINGLFAHHMYESGVVP